MTADALTLTIAANEGSPGGLFIPLAIMAVVIAACWKVFIKAGHPGWAAIVPIYNIIVLLQIANKPIWWIVGLFIPIVNIAVTAMVGLAVAERFGRGPGFGIGLAFLPFIFYPILGFGDASYRGATVRQDIAPAA